MSDESVVRAAGGVVVRGEGPDRRVALVHRPRYDDWSFPKGKLLDGEPEETAALREVREETGLVCRLGRHVGAVTYLDRNGRSKVVRYWTMTPDGGEFEPGEEVDELRWATPEEARVLLTYPHDRSLLRTVVEMRTPAPIYVVRHAKAGRRQLWAGLDADRPLTRRGRRQARRLVERFRGLEISSVVSSPYARCVQTVEPLASSRGLAVQVAAPLAEGAEVADAVAFVRGLGDEPVVLCGHGREIAAVVAMLEMEGAAVAGIRGLAKGSVWVLDREDGRVVSARYLPAPPG